MEENNLTVGGYLFATIADAETAKLEEKKVENLNQHLDYNKPQNVLLVYNKAIENRVFYTPIGTNYLLKMQKDLEECGIPKEKIQPIPLRNTFSNMTERNRMIARSITAKKAKVEYKANFITSLLINIVLFMVILAMFIIAWKSETPNMINYRTTIINEYSEWEQDLQEREKIIREKERELNQ